jgi:Protein of unknown function (DUF1403)
LPHDKRGGFLARTGDKAPLAIHHATVIRADLEPSPDPLVDPTADGAETVAAPTRPSLRAKRASANPLPTLPFPPPAAPSWARASGRSDGDPLFAAGAALALLDAHLRRDPPATGALRARLALQSAAACAKVLRLNVDAAALRDLRFAVGGEPPPAAKLLSSWRELASRPPGFDPARLAAAAAALDLPAPNADVLAETLREESRAGDPVSAAAKAAASAFSLFPNAPAAEAEILALWAFDLVLAIRLLWPRPVPLTATRILDPSLRSDGEERRARPGDPAWPKAAAAALALAATAALDLAADLCRRADALLEVAPKLRAKPAQRIVDLLLAEDCVSPAEAARHAPMTDRAARRLFDRLVALGAAREVSGRPAFRLYGL